MMLCENGLRVQNNDDPKAIKRPQMVGDLCLNCRELW